MQVVNCLLGVDIESFLPDLLGDGFVPLPIVVAQQCDIFISRLINPSNTENAARSERLLDCLQGDMATVSRYDEAVQRDYQGLMQPFARNGFSQLGNITIVSIGPIVEG